MKIAQRSMAIAVAMLACSLAGCPKAPSSTDTQGGASPLSVGDSAGIELVDLSDPMHPVASPPHFSLQAARNEWTSIVLQVKAIPARKLSIQISGQGPWDRANLRAYQVLPMPVQVNPEYVRHTGLSTADRTVPRALLPINWSEPAISLGELRDPVRPFDPAAHPGDAASLLWIDVHVPSDTPAGNYPAKCELIDTAGRAVSGTDVQLTVFDFALPAERHLQICGRLDWDRMSGLFPEAFNEAVQPNLINRREPRYARTVAALDRLMQLTEENRVTIIVPGIRPTVKWPAGEVPEIDWREFDALVTPWLGGGGFSDHVRLGYWPLPGTPNLALHDEKARVDYWTLAAGHFDQLGWLDSTAAELIDPANRPTNAEIAAEGGKVLAASPRLRVVLPLRDADLTNPAAIPSQELSRVLTEAPGLISSALTPGIGADVRRRSHWLEPGIGGGGAAGAACDQRDVRMWAWLAFLRQAELLYWNHPIPESSAITQPTDVNATAWFYPGSWFGVDQPVPTLQLKWVRRAEQDYEYLWLARDRGELIGALQMARLITKPVEILPGQQPDPAFSLMSGTPNQEAWDRAQELLAENILLRRPGEPADENRQRAVYIKTLQWAEPQEQPVLISHGAKWTLDPRSSTTPESPRGNWLSLQFDLDIYNASDTTPYKNVLRWSAPVPDSGWQMANVGAVDVPRLQTYHVEPAKISAAFNLDRISPASLQPVGLTFINGYTDAAYPYVARLPVAAIDRRDKPVTVNGKLDDWSESDAVQDGPLVTMMNRPDLQKANLQYAPVSAKIYCSWDRSGFNLAFTLAGLSPTAGRQAHNEVYYRARRAWGEDLAEAIIQPVYADNTLGPVLHVVFKPGGALWVERKMANGASGAVESNWESIEGAGLRYATMTTEDHRWLGEAALPWKLINGSDHGPAVLLRFNFAQHQTATCQSATWCGPVDFGRDDQMMGVLYLRNASGR